MIIEFALLKTLECPIRFRMAAPPCTDKLSQKSSIRYDSRSDTRLPQQRDELQVNSSLSLLLFSCLRSQTRSALPAGIARQSDSRSEEPTPGKPWLCGTASGAQTPFARPQTAQIAPDPRRCNPW